VAIALHNFPEGLAIGASYGVGDVGFTICILIAIHDFPEGMAMASPMRLGGMNRWKPMMYAALSGLPTVIGAVIGSVATSINQGFVGISIASAAGAMAYLTFAKMIVTDSGGVWALIVGLILGMLITFGI